MQLKTDKLLKIYLQVKRKPKPVYKPTRKHYNIHLYG